MSSMGVAHLCAAKMFISTAVPRGTSAPPTTQPSRAQVRGSVGVGGQRRSVSRSAAVVRCKARTASNGTLQIGPGPRTQRISSRMADCSAGLRASS